MRLTLVVLACSYLLLLSIIIFSSITTIFNPLPSLCCCPLHALLHSNAVTLQREKARIAEEARHRESMRLAAAQQALELASVDGSQAGGGVGGVGEDGDDGDTVESGSDDEYLAMERGVGKDGVGGGSRSGSKSLAIAHTPPAATSRRLTDVSAGTYYVTWLCLWYCFASLRFALLCMVVRW